MDTNDWIERLERQFRGTSTTEEDQSLRAHLETDEVFREEATQYRTLWRGFEELQAAEFRAQINSWEKNEAIVDEDELLEWYANDQLSPANRERVAAKISSNPALAAASVQHQQLAKGWQAAQQEDFQERMQTWETGAREATPIRSLGRRLIRPLAAAAAVLVLLFVGANWYAQTNYSDGPVAADFVDAQKPMIGIVLGDNPPAGDPNQDFLVDFAEARKTLQNGEYEAALQSFSGLQTALLDTDFTEKQITYYQDHLEWNYLLARLGAGDTGNDFTLRLNSVADNDLHTCQDVAADLRTQLQSFWRKLAE